MTIAKEPSKGPKVLASIDIGSHTARLLVSERTGPGGLFQTLVRERLYIRLADRFPSEGKAVITAEAIKRTLKALQRFNSMTRKFPVEAIQAVCTGVVRRAENREDFLDLIYKQTGIRAKVISGAQEAQFTALGVLGALDIQHGPFLIFDLGGGSTEFVCGGEENKTVNSVPLGAAVLTQKYLSTDPPQGKEIEATVREVDGILQKAFPKETCSEEDLLIVGTGGTVTTLAAIIYCINLEEINPERMNGLILERAQLEDLFTQMKTMTVGERLKLPGLDRGRADVILAGLVVVLRILHLFKSLQVTVSLSDLLEGMMLAYIHGEDDE
jgi:exopolyphosphatase/guanosine-5'-triphosphate,3'-diphosphate pyrophosphatase